MYVYVCACVCGVHAVRVFVCSVYFGAIFLVVIAAHAILREAVTEEV